MEGLNEEQVDARVKMGMDLLYTQLTKETEDKLEAKLKSLKEEIDEAYKEKTKTQLEDVQKTMDIIERAHADK